MSAAKKKIDRLIERGAKIPNPHSVEIGEEVNVENIAGQDLTIHGGCRIFGKNTVILPGATLGKEAPVTVDNCRIAENVELGGGSFQESVFLAGVKIGPGAQIRAGCLLEESVRAAHTVGLKQTILFPYVTLGSLINFCDCLMAGGTSPKNHSEVGSSYIHFNYTPNQDKATPSLIGDVPSGVMLHRNPIFLGGQGGLVGPSRIAYGAVIAAGVVFRGDALEENRLYTGKPLRKEMTLPFHPGLYRNIEQVLKKNLIYLGSLAALGQWYRQIRRHFFGKNEDRLIWDGAVTLIEMDFIERLNQLKQLAKNMPRSLARHGEIKGDAADDRSIQQQSLFFDRWQALEEALRKNYGNEGDRVKRDAFMRHVEKKIQAHGPDYLETVQNLETAYRSEGTAWLQSIINGTVQRASEILPQLNLGGGNPQG